MAGRAIIVRIVCLAISLLAAGCAIAPKQTANRAPLTAEQIAWWEANKHRRVYVPNKGWYVEGTSGFFDDNGRKLSGDELTPQEEPNVLENLAPKKAMANFKKAIGRGPNEDIARRALAEGDALFRQKDYAQAAKKYREAYKRWPDSPLEEEAMFKAGESEFFADRYVKADDEYAALVKKYTSTQYLGQVVTRRFAIGRYWEQYDAANPHWPLTPNVADKTRPLFDTLGHARKTYERVRLDQPTGPLADDSVMATANCYFVHGRYDDADYHYDLLRKEYPRSEFQFQAHLLGLQCKLLKYQGAAYDQTPLEQAEELAVQLLTQFPTELGNERERIVQDRARIRSMRAEREWERAEYYAKGEHYGSSKIFYEKIVKEFPDTQLAQQARTRLDETQGLPDHPTPFFQPLVDLLPASKKDGPVLPKTVMTATNAAATRQQSPR